MTMLRRILLTAALGLFLTLSAASAATDASDSAAQAFIRSLAQQAITTAADRGPSDAQRNARFRTLFVNSFDIPEIGQFVLSRYWRTATPDQQQAFLKLFEEYNVLIWAKRFKDYGGEQVEVGAAVKSGNDNWSVDSRVDRPQGAPIALQWRLHRGEDGNLRVIDIFVGGVSMALANRSDYSAAMQANGGKIDSLLSTLRTKIEQLRAAG